jgi:hypothetical protein
MRVLVLCLVLFGCGGIDPGDQQMMQNTVGDGGGGGAGKVGDACTMNGDCESDLCTKESYDRKPGPVCTYQCDPANPNPKCPNGCNMKGFCRIPS